MACKLPLTVGTSSILDYSNSLINYTACRHALDDLIPTSGVSNSSYC